MNNKNKNKNNNKQSKTVTNVSVVVQDKNKIGRLSKSRVSNVRRGSEYLKLYMNPFDLDHAGAKVMDPQSKYTDTFTLRGEFRIINPANTVGSNNTAAYCIKPNPFMSIIDVQSWSGGPSTSSAVGFIPFASNTYAWGMSTPADFRAKMSNYRVVSHGFRVRLMSPQLETTGRMIVARAPRSRADPIYNVFENLTFGWNQQTADRDNITTIPLNPVGNSSALLQFPDAFEISLIDMIGNDLTLVNAINSYQAFSFLMPGADIYDNVIDSAARTEIGPGGSATGTVGAQTVAYGGFQDSPIGWDDFYLFFDGLPQRASATPIVNVEMIFHLEGVPSISSSTTISPVPSHPPSSGLGATAQQILDAGAKMARAYFTTAAQSFVSRTFTDLTHGSRGAPRVTL